MSPIKSLASLSLLFCAALFACGTQPTENMLPDAGSSIDAGADAAVPTDGAPPGDGGASACTPPTGTTAPTYTQLFTNYFAADKPGGCARSGCHGDSARGGWKCGTTKETCYQGMLGKGLISATNPTGSRIASTTASPLTWINSSSSASMPQGGPAANSAAATAIKAWAAACAQNN